MKAKMYMYKKVVLILAVMSNGMIASDNTPPAAETPNLTPAQPKKSDLAEYFFGKKGALELMKELQINLDITKEEKDAMSEEEIFYGVMDEIDPLGLYTIHPYFCRNESCGLCPARRESMREMQREWNELRKAENARQNEE